MLNFTVGAEQVPYFRTPEFSAVMLENEKLMKKFAKAGNDARVVFITGSGTAAMEATVMNVFDRTDKVLVVNGGSFGQRFVELCQIHEIPYESSWICTMVKGLLGSSLMYMKPQQVFTMTLR